MSSFENEKLKSQVIKGKVTEVNYSLLIFKLNKTLRVYIDVTKHLPEFPQINDEVEIINPKKVIRRTGTIIIGPDTICNWPEVCAIDNATVLELFRVLKANNVNEDELIAMDHILRQLESCVKEYLLPKCLKALLYYAPFDTKGLQKTFKKSQIKLPSDLQYVNEISELYSFIKFDGKCLYNVYHSQSLETVTDSHAEYLFGILDVDPVIGCFFLSDDHSKIPVKFYSTSYDLSKFNNSLVMLRKWTVFTEIFEEKSVPSFNYIFLNFEDVVIIESVINNNHKKLFYGINELLDTGQSHSLFLQPVKISEIIYGYSKGAECYMEAFISESNSFSSKRLIYVILTDQHIAIVPFLKEGVVYKLYFNENPTFLKLASYKELYRLRKIRQLYGINKDTIFQETTETPFPENKKQLESFQEVETVLKSCREYESFTFCLQLAKKTINNNNFASWISKRHNDAPYFGTPGKNKQIHVVFWNPITNSYIDLYLRDRDNHVTPFGLFESMKVKFKHVEVCKRKYLTTNVFSSFEIMEYCPEIMFSSVNLSFNDRLTWQWKNETPQTLLGMYTSLPQQCIVHGTFLFQAIRALKITPICDVCKKPSVAERPCNTCHINDRDLNIQLSICVQDTVNPRFYIDTENKYFFLELLGIKNKIDVKHFNNAFCKIGILNINFCDLTEFRIFCTKDAKSKQFVDELIKTIMSDINFNLYPMVRTVCIKQKEGDARCLKIIEFCFM